jgi:outer membrane protein W
MKHSVRFLQLAGLVFFNVSLPAAAHGQAFEPSWNLKLELAMVEPTGDATTVAVGTAGVDVDFDPKAGAGVRIEYRMSERIGIELGALGASSFGVTVGGIGSGIGTSTEISSFAPITAGINLYFAETERASVYAGPFVGAVRYGDVSTSTGIGGVSTGASTDTDFGWGGLLGFDFRLGESRWSLQGSVRYIDTVANGDIDGEEFRSEFSPVILTAGVAYRF